MKKPKVDPFKALADPRRRKIIQLLLVSSSLSLHAITENFDMSRQALTRHINTLQESGILKPETKGRETIYHLDLEPLKEVYDVVSYYHSFWENKLDKLDQLMNTKKA
ncbi:MAG: metalloregulator ArsR/SmtB family transcription factor [Cyclobacteriaceae bacterium]